MENQNQKTTSTVTRRIIVISLSAIVLLFILYSIAMSLRPIGHPPRRMYCKGNLKQISIALTVYMFDNSTSDIVSVDSLPTPEKWNDLFIEDLMNKRDLCCQSEKLTEEKRSTYVLNSNLYNLRGEIPPDMVVAFEGPIGWNQIGGPEMMTYRDHGNKIPMCFVLLGDATVISIKENSATKLKWKP